LDFILIAAAAIAWTVALRAVWRHDIFERALGLTLAGPVGRATSASPK